MSDEPTIFTDSSAEKRWLDAYYHGSPRSIPQAPPPTNIVTVEFLCRHRCEVHGRTNHVVGYDGRVMCVECNPLVARKAMAENVRYDG